MLARLIFGPFVIASVLLCLALILLMLLFQEVICLIRGSVMSAIKKWWKKTDGSP
jgi:hypothetical protein